jgi:hypothetical protein
LQPLVQPPQPPVTFVAPHVERQSNRCAHRAVRLAQVPAVGKAASRSERLDFGESERHGVEPVDRRREVAHPGRIDERAAIGQIVEPGRGRGVTAFVIAQQRPDVGRAERYERT